MAQKVIEGGNGSPAMNIDTIDSPTPSFTLSLSILIM